MKSPKHVPEQNLSIATDCPASWAVFTLARSHRALAASKLATVGLFPGQELILMQLWDEDGQSQKALGRTQRLDHSTIAKSVRRLENAGLVRREKSFADGRVSLVFLTDAGTELKTPVLALWADLEQQTVAGLTAEERALFVALTDKILPHVDESAAT